MVYLKSSFNINNLTCASSAITPQPITVIFFSFLSQSQVLNCCGVLRLTLIVRLFLVNVNNGVRIMRVFTAMVMVLMMSGLVRATTIEDLEMQLRDIKSQIADQERRIIRLEGRSQVRSKSTPEPQSNAGNDAWKEIQSWSKIKQGMSRRQVESILGKPTSVKKNVVNWITLIYQGDNSYSSYISGNVEIDENDRVIVVRPPVM